jgi:hypothetical protein
MLDINIDKLIKYQRNVKPSRLVSRVFLVRRQTMGDLQLKFFTRFKYSDFTEDFPKFVSNLTKRQKARLCKDIRDFKR